MSICIPIRFWSNSKKWRRTKSEISNLTQLRDHDVFENSLLIHLHLFELDQKRKLEEIQSGPKAESRHVIMNFEKKSRCT